jgi:hypothetical protein
VADMSAVRRRLTAHGPGSMLWKLFWATTLPYFLKTNVMKHFLPNNYVAVFGVKNRQCFLIFWRNYFKTHNTVHRTFISNDWKNLSITGEMLCFVW